MHSVSRELSLILVTICLQFLVLQGLGSLITPPNCQTYECPAYTAIYTNEKFEIRAYKTANWISFPVTSSSFDKVQKQGIDQVLAYVDGKNSAGVKTGLTAPIIIDLGFATGSSFYKTKFFLPAKFQANPPFPTSGSGQVEKLPPAKYAAVTRYFGGLDQNTASTTHSELRNSLIGTAWEAAAAVKPYSVAGYTAPFQPDPVFEILIWFNQ